MNLDIRDEDEADYYARKVQERAVIGEAFNGATKDWSIVDVPPGTERIQLDGVGGGSQEITWQRYNGVRRSKFNPERERKREEPERVEKRIEIREREREGPNRTSEHIEIRERQVLHLLHANLQLLLTSTSPTLAVVNHGAMPVDQHTREKENTNVLRKALIVKLASHYLVVHQRIEWVIYGLKSPRTW